MVVYKITNTVNGKIYIGKWQGSDVQRRWQTHVQTAMTGRGYHLHSAIRKYGADHFTIEIIGSADSKSNLAALERTLIASYNATNSEVGYNIAPGGEGGFSYSGKRNPFYGKHHTAETKATLSLKCGRVGRKKTIEEIEKLRLSHLGRSFSKEHCQHISEAKRGTPLSEQRRVECIVQLRSLKRTPEWGARISAALKGKPKSAEHRRHLSETRLKKVETL